MKLTREEALKLHRQMWTDMQKELGDNPSRTQRTAFKYEWIRKHFPGEYVESGCFLCEYRNQTTRDCEQCPIDWGYNYVLSSSGCEFGKHKWGYIPISVLLALPEREGV